MSEALAVKYRPKTWDDVVEQSATKVILQNQLDNGEIKNAYLFCGPAGCGKTTCARIFANEINKGVGTPIELDAASNNSVDDVRNIIAQAQTASIDSEYKVFLLDECVTGDVEILTTAGFKRFDECCGTEIVAQYNNGNIEFVKPSEWIKQRYVGDIIKWSPRNWCSIKMTPNHVQPLYYSKSKKIKEEYIKDVKFSQAKNLIVSGKGTGAKTSLSPLDRLAIVCQADATIQVVTSDYTRWSVQLTKQRKIDRLLKIFEDGNIQYKEIKGRAGTRRFAFNTPNTVTKFLRTHFDLDVDFNYARQFIEEVVSWDGYSTKDYVEYMSVEKGNADFVAAMGVLGCYNVRQRVQEDNRKDSYRPVNKVFLYDTQYVNCQHIAKTVTTEDYDDMVYCVKVPSHQIVIRSQGFVFITGNCHALSNNAWQAMLKILEEPPKKAIFILCTTERNKIPKTILSRVQQFEFRRISQQGILDRLIDILGKEFEYPDVESEALEYIAKLSDGGMRDAITMLDKTISLSSEITVENVMQAVGTENIETMIILTDMIMQSNVREIVNVIDKIHSEGKDLKLFIKQYTEFILDVSKAHMLGSLKYTKLPDIESIKDMLSESEDYFNSCLDLLDELIKLGVTIKWNSSPKSVIEATLIVFSRRKT